VESADEFGIRYLYPSAADAMTWTSSWEGRRTFRGIDPADPWFDADNDAATYRVADGELAISGEVPRMFIRDPRQVRQWRDVEITMYFKRVADDGVDYAGMVSVARSNHGVTGDESEDGCDSRGIGARMRYDGLVDFEKETVHPIADVAAQKPLWRGGMPKNAWIGYKHVVYDLPDGAVRQELWLDRSGGRDGGDWVKINQVTDNGNTFGEVPCSPGVDPRMPLTNDPDRAGSESGKPNISVYFRSDGVHRDGLVYKWGSVREIAAPTAARAGD